MLEKAPGDFLIQKLHILSLLEADCNTLYNINFNGMLIPSLEDSSNAPQEIIGSRRSQAATHLALRKIIIEDVSNTKKLSATTTHAEATKCYDRVAHHRASLCVQCFGMDLSYLVVLFRTIKK